MKKLLGILVLGLLWCGNVNAAGEDICGIQSNLSNMADATVAIKIGAYVKVKDNGCAPTSFGFHTISEVCMEMEPYKFYLFANYGKVTVGKNLFDKNLDNDFAFDELANFLN